MGQCGATDQIQILGMHPLPRVEVSRDEGFGRISAAPVMSGVEFVIKTPCHVSTTRFSQQLAQLKSRRVTPCHLETGSGIEMHHLEVVTDFSHGEQDDRGNLLQPAR